MEREVAEVALKVIPVVLGAVVPLIRILSHFGGRRSKLREEYEFARDYLTDLQDSVTKDSAFLKQKGCLAITGSPSVHFETLERLLHLADPSKAIRNYTFSYKLLEPHNDRETSLRFKDSYTSYWRRFLAKSGYFLGYVGTYLIATSPVLAHAFAVEGSAFPLKQLALTATLFLPLSYLSLRAGVRIHRAEEVVRADRGRHVAESFSVELGRLVGRLNRSSKPPRIDTHDDGAAPPQAVRPHNPTIAQN